MIAALFVHPSGPYVGREGVDPWPESRDARLYAGPWPVVAHPPCQRWGRYAEGGPSAPRTRRVGDDGGCFAAALLAGEGLAPGSPREVEQELHEGLGGQEALAGGEARESASLLSSAPLLLRVKARRGMPPGAPGRRPRCERDILTLST